MDAEMKAIETEYKGYRFRSRLEARWAVFFDCLGITWFYEHEGYETADGWYLPDFYLPECKAVVEVKPTIGAFEEDLRWNALRKNKPDDVEQMLPVVGVPDLENHPMYWLLMWVGRIDWMDLGDAVEAAKSARFEHGESPVTA